MIRRLVVAALAVAGTLPLGAAPAYARVEDQPPKLIGLTYAVARETLRTWWPTVQIEVPAGLPADLEAGAFTVDDQVLRNPGWSTESVPADPLVALALSTTVPDVVGVSLAEATRRLAARGMDVSASPRTAGSDWLVESQKPTAGEPVRVFARRLAVVVRAVAPAPATGEPTAAPPPPPLRRTAVVVAAAAGVPLLVLLAVLGFTLRRRRSRTPRGEPRVEAVHPPPDIRVEPLGHHPQWTITLAPRGDTGTHELEEIR